MSFDWTVARKAVVDWIKLSTGTDVGWGNQDAPIPDYPAGVLNVIAVVPTDPRPEERRETDLGQDPGEEVLLKHVRQYRMTISVQILTRQKMDSSFDWDAGAFALATEAGKALGLTTQREALRVAGLSFISAGEVTDLSTVEGAGFTDRAQLDAIFAFADSVDERTGYIATALVSSDFTGADPSLDLENEPMGEPLP